MPDCHAPELEENLQMNDYHSVGTHTFTPEGVPGFYFEQFGIPNHLFHCCNTVWKFRSPQASTFPLKPFETEQREFG